MIGSGQYVRLVLWHGNELVHDGLLLPGESAALRFVDGPVTVDRFEVVRLTKAEAEALPAPAAVAGAPTAPRQTEEPRRAFGTEPPNAGGEA